LKRPFKHWTLADLLGTALTISFPAGGLCDKFRAVSVTAINLIAGAALMLFGRRLFWLFVAGVGFVVGAKLAADFLTQQPQWVILAIAGGLGLIGAIISVFLQRLVAGIAGFLAGGYVFYMLAVDLNYEKYAWIAMAAGGVLGAFMALSLFNWALVILSSLFGAAVIIQNVQIETSMSSWAFIGLFAVGLIVQTKQLTGKKAAAKSP